MASTAGALFLAEAFGRLSTALEPLSGGEIITPLKAEAKARASNPALSSKGGNSADPLSQALVLDLALSVIANQLECEENTKRIDELQLLVATAAREKDRALGKLPNNMSRNEYLQLKTEILSLIISDLLPSDTVDDRDEDHVPKMNIPNHGSSLNSFARNTSAEPYLLSDFLIDEEVVRFAHEEKRGSFGSLPRKGSNASLPSITGSERRDFRADIMRQTPDVPLAPLAARPRRNSSASVQYFSETFASDRDAPFLRPRSGSMTQDDRVHSHRRPINRIPLASIRPTDLNVDSKPLREDRGLVKRNTVMPDARPLKQPIRNDNGEDENEKERATLFLELQRTKEEFHTMRKNEGRMVSELAQLVEELQSRVVDVQRHAQDSLAVKEEELVVLRAEVRKKDHEVTMLKERILALEAATSKDFAEEIQALAADFDREREEWRRIQKESDILMTELRTSLEARFEKEKELAVIAATEAATEMAADEARIQLEEFQARMDAEIKETKRNLMDGYQLEIASLKDSHRSEVVHLNAALDESQEALQKLQSQMEAISSQLNCAQTERSEVDMKSIKAEAALAELAAEYDVARNSLSQMQNLQMEYNSLRDQLNAQLEQVHLLESEKQRLQQILGKERASLNTTSSELENALKASEVRRAELEQELNRTRVRFEEERDLLLETMDTEKGELLERLNEEWSTRLKTKQVELDDLTKHATNVEIELLEKIGSSQQVATSLETRIAELEKDHVALRMKYDESLAALNENAVMVESIKKERDVYHSSLQALQEQYQHVQGELRTCKEQLTTVQEERNALAKKCESHEQKLIRYDEVQAEHVQLLEQVNILQAKISSQGQQASNTYELEAELQRVRSEFDTKTLEYTKTISELQAALSESSGHIQMLQGSLRDESERLEFLKLDQATEMEQVQARMKSLEKERNSLTEKLEGLESELIVLRNERHELSGFIATLLKEHDLVQEELSLDSAKKSELQQRLIDEIARVREDARLEVTKELEAKYQQLLDQQKRQLDERKALELGTLRRDLEAKKYIELSEARKALAAESESLKHSLHAEFDSKCEQALRNAVENAQQLANEAFHMEREEMRAKFDEQVARLANENAELLRQVQESARHRQVNSIFSGHSENGNEQPNVQVDLDAQLLEELNARELELGQTKAALRSVENDLLSLRAEYTSVTEKLKTLEEAVDQSRERKSNAFEIMRLSAELRIAREQARVAQEKLEIETRKFRSEAEARARELKRHSDEAKAGQDDSQSLHSAIQKALEDNDARWQALHEAECARKVTEAVVAARAHSLEDLRVEREALQIEYETKMSALVRENSSNNAAESPRKIVALRSISDSSIFSQQVPADDLDEMRSVAGSLKRSMDSILVLVRELSSVARKSTENLDCIDPDAKLQSYLHTLMRERAVFAKGIMNLQRCLGEDKGEGMDHTHTPLAERKSIGDSSAAALDKGEAAELESVLLDDVEL